jgi:hypothetical protein
MDLLKRTKLLPDRDVVRRYNVSFMTLWRWDHDPSLGFPRPLKIRGRNYRDESELDAFDMRMRRQCEPRANDQQAQAVA